MRTRSRFLIWRKQTASHSRFLISLATVTPFLVQYIYSLHYRHSQSQHQPAIDLPLPTLKFESTEYVFFTSLAFRSIYSPFFSLFFSFYFVKPHQACSLYLGFNKGTCCLSLFWWSNPSKSFLLWYLLVWTNQMIPFHPNFLFWKSRRRGSRLRA